MSADFIAILPAKGARLLRVLVGEIKSGRIQKRQPETFISYSEALEKLGIQLRGRAGQQLQREGLNELNGWTQAHAVLPKVAGLIVNKKSHQPSPGYPKSHGLEGSGWRDWWLNETDRAIEFDWSRFLKENGQVAQESSRTNEEPEARQYRDVITIEPGKRGGRPCIRGMRITVGDVLGWLAAGNSEKEIMHDFPELTAHDIRASLAYAADRENILPKPTAADGQPTNLPAVAARLKQMRGFLRGIDTTVPCEFDRV